jgi:hypothetical protein
VAAVLVSIALFIAIARLLRFSTGMTVLAGLCFALSPATQMLHGVGEIDHHYAEQIFILAALASGLAWLRNPERLLHAALAALTLGVAPAIHNGLFIIQLPLLATLFVLWLQGKPVPRKASLVFAATLMTATLAILIPSLPFRLGHFDFYTLSWFHLYIAACSGIAVAMLSHLPATRRSGIVIAAAGAAALVPIVGQMALAQSFIAGTPIHLRTIGEMQSPLRAVEIFGAQYLSRIYSYFIWIAPLTALLCLIQCWRDRFSERLLLWISAAMGLALLAMQLRLHYFGDFALYLPWLVLLQDFASRRPELQRKVLLLASVVLLVLYFPPLRHQLVAPMARSNDMSFENLQPIFAAMRKACAENPGIVLADADAGHYIRYYTDCKVVANNFLLTPQQMQKVDEVQRLFSMTARQLESEAPYITYVLLRPARIGPGPDGKLRYTFRVTSPRLAGDLLLGTQQSVPKDYVLLDEVRFPALGNAPYARLYEIRRDPHGAVSGQNR